MRTLVHISDLHFGRIDNQTLAPLREVIGDLRPDVVVVSGDLTQRARSAQFRQARHYLDTLPQPQIIVPGNHDIPLYNVAARFFRPLVKYRRHITRDLAPEFIDDEIAVLGLNTARSLTFKDGRVNRQQVHHLQQRFGRLHPHLTRVVVTHHPFDLPPHFARNELVDRAPMAMEVFARCGVDLLLAGHLHSSHSHNSAARYQISGYAALVVQAGTATSTRARGEANSFNVLRVEHDEIQVQLHRWTEGAGFALAGTDVFHREGDVWRPSHQEPA